MQTALQADEQKLVREAQLGNPGAFRYLVERYMKHAYNIAYGFVNDHDEAEDIAQESFVRVHRSLAGFRGDAVFSTWLYRIVANLALNRVRQKKSQARYETRTTDDMQLIASASHDQTIQRMELQEHMERALHELPTLQRAVVILRHLNGLSTRQVGTILKCSDGTVKTHLHRGLKKMKVLVEHLQDHV